MENMAFDLDDEELKSTLEWRYGKTEPKKEETTFSIGTAYDINKQLIEKYEHELSNNDYEDKKNLLEDFMKQYNNYKYFMLLCHEQRDYTIFNHISNKPFTFLWKELTECLKNRGKIYSFEITKDKQAIEIWIKIEKEMYCYYFFNYDKGVIEY